MADNSEISGAGLGAASGAVSGAGLGTTIAPGLGTAIGALGGAIIGGVSGAVKAKYDRQQVEEERERLQKREDTARTRAVLDSLGAGVDPRTQDKGVEPAASGSVAPPVLDPNTGFSESVGVGSSAILDGLKQQQDLEMGVFGEILKHYNTYQSDGYKAVGEINSQIDNLISDFKELSVNSDESVVQADTFVQTQTENVHQSLTRHQFTDSEVKLFRDILSGKKDKSKEQKEEFGAQGDLISAGAQIVDNVIESVSPSEDIVRDFNRSKKDGQWRQVGERRVSRDNGEGGPGTPKEKSIDKDSRQKSKRKGLGLSGSYSEIENEGSEDSRTQQLNDDEHQNRDETHFYQFTDEEINRLTKIFVSNKLNRYVDTHKDLSNHYDKDSRMKFVSQYSDLLSYRADTLKRAQMSPADYCSKYAPLVKHIFGDMRFRNRYKFYNR